MSTPGSQFTFTPSRLARLAYSAMVERAAEIQDEIVKQEAIDKRFGDDALPVSKLMRGYKDLLRNGAVKRGTEDRLRRHAEYIAGIREFEKLFEIEEKENLQAFAQAFKDRMKEPQP